jgi:hypothetical protein
MIKAFFKIKDFDEILNICLGSEADSDNFLTFIKIIGNESVIMNLQTRNDQDLNEVRKILNNIVCNSKNDNGKLKKFVQKAFSKALVKDSVDHIAEILKAAPKDVLSYFKKEEMACKSLNPFAFVDLTEMLLKEVPDVLFEAPKGEFKQLLTIILLNAMIYRGDAKLLNKLYGLFLKIASHICLYVDFIPKSVKGDILSLKILQKMIKATNYDYGSTSVNSIKVTEEQKLILEIIFQLNEIESKTRSVGLESMYEISESVREMETAK